MCWMSARALCMSLAAAGDATWVAAAEAGYDTSDAAQ
jgi:hypothetical protein